ncbi:MAG: DctP family TRAP transporter solute-binding subunit [Lachnospiraceae bacterium]|nr:DctP family TRAP transporter solute-binding subunit [Lachnospiraceae bacterium]
MKKVLSVLLIAAIAISMLAGCSSKKESASTPQAGTETTKTETSEATKDPLSFKLTVTGTEIAIDTLMGQKFAELVSEATDGQIEVTVYPNDQLAGGNQTKGIEMLGQGIADFGIYGISTLAILDKRVAVANLPYLFADYADANSIFDSTGGEFMEKVFADVDLVYLGNAHNSFRQISNNKHTVKTPDDIKGLKIRIPGGQIFLDIWKAFGADPITMSWSEVFTALQQGTIDGQDNGPKASDSNSIYEVNKFYTVFNYMYDGYPLIMSKKAWDKLDADQQAIIKECATEAIAWARNEIETNDEKILQKFADEYNVEVTYLTAEEQEPFKALVAPIVEEYKGVYGEEACKAFGVE